MFVATTSPPLTAQPAIPAQRAKFFITPAPPKFLKNRKLSIAVGPSNTFVLQVKQVINKRYVNCEVLLRLLDS